jgi:serine-type D-Ala-D-Ala carboxypeptidase (penicillin-binding protein 5/6)
LIVALVVCLIGAQPATARRPNVSCRACLVVDDEGHVLFDRNAERRLANASTTKMVTALVTLEYLDPADVLTVPRAVLAVGGGTLDLHPGDRFVVQDLLIAMMLDSSNDAAITLAHAVSGSESAFVREMNSFVEELNLDDTAFVTSHGLDEPGHYSSAHDLATIGRLVIENERLAKIVAKPRATISTPQGRRRLDNRNLLLERYHGALGIKTGYTLDAGYVLVAAARRHGRTLIAVVMGSADSFADAAVLLDRGFRRLRRSVVAQAGLPAAALVFDSLGSTPVGLARTVRGPYHPGSVSFDFAPHPRLELPVARGQSVGTIELMVEGRVIEAVEARALRGVRAPESSWGTSFFAGLLGFFEPLAAPA